MNRTDNQQRNAQILLEAVSQRMTQPEFSDWTSEDRQAANLKWRADVQGYSNLSWMHDKQIEQITRLLRLMPSRDFLNPDLSLHILVDQSLWVLHSNEMHPWSLRISEEDKDNFVIPYASLSEVRDAWRYDPCVMILERMPDLPREVYLNDTPLSSVQATVAEHIKKHYLAPVRTGASPVVHDPSASPPLISPHQLAAVIAPGDHPRRGTTATLAVFLCGCLRAAGVPCRVEGVRRWKDGPSLNGEKGQYWVRVKVGEEWKVLSVAPEDADLGLGKAWFLNGDGKIAKEIETSSLDHGVWASVFGDSKLAASYPAIEGMDGAPAFGVEVTGEYMP